MDLVSTLAEVDPVFTDVVKALYGELVDPREAWDIAKAGPDSSEVHIDRAERKRRKRQAQVGLASNFLGIAAGGAALGSSGLLLHEKAKARNPKGGPVSAKLIGAGKRGRRGMSFVAKHPKKLIVAGAAGAAGLQGANLAGDVVANRVLNREAKRKISKALDDILAARRLGVIDDEQAIELGEQLELEYEYEVGKKLSMNQVARGFHSPAVGQASKAVGVRLKQITSKPPSQPTSAQALTANRAVKNSVRTAVGVGTGAGAATGTAVGMKIGQKQQTQQRQPVRKSADDEVELTWTGEIAKRDDDKHQIFGWCSISQVGGEKVVDLQNDYVPIDEIEKAAYGYVLSSRKGGDMHSRVGKSSLGDEPLQTSDMIESFVVTEEKLEKMGLAPDSMPHGWWVGFKVHDDTAWNLVKSGERTGFSIHGKGKRTTKEI